MKKPKSNLSRISMAQILVKELKDRGITLTLEGNWLKIPTAATAKDLEAINYLSDELKVVVGRNQ